MGDRVHDRLRHHLLRDLVAHRRLRAGLAGPDREGDLAEDEVHRRVHEIEDRALVDLVGRDRFGHLGAVEVGALDLGGDQEPLRLLSKEKERCVRQLPVIKQVQVLQQFGGRCIGGEGEPAGRSGRTDEPCHPFRVQNAGRRPGTRGRVEGTGADQLLLHQVLDERRIQPGDQFRGGIEPLPDQPRLCPSDERTHLWMAVIIVRAPDIDEPALPLGSGEIELPFGRGEPSGVLGAVVTPEQPDIDVTTPNLVEVQVVSAAVGGRDVLE